MIDLNSDLGEGNNADQLDNDKRILDVVTSANIACGFHAGDSKTMAQTVETATERGVIIGAHVSYNDRLGFGRRYMDVAPNELMWDVAYQLGALDAIARTAGNRVRYVKPHGALYNQIAIDEIQARSVIKGIAAYDRSLVLLTLPGSTAMRVAKEMGLSVIAEGFADRAYSSDGRLVPRQIPGAVIDEVSSVVTRAVQMAREGTVISIDGQTIHIGVRSICLHSDTKGSGSLATKIREALQDACITISPFVD